MKNFAKKAFSTAALVTGGAGVTWGGFGLITGGWSSTGSAGIDLTEIGVIFTLISAGIFYAGYKGITNAALDAKPPAVKSDGPS